MTNENLNELEHEFHQWFNMIYHQMNHSDLLSLNYNLSDYLNYLNIKIKYKLYEKDLRVHNGPSGSRLIIFRADQISEIVFHDQVFKYNRVCVKVYAIDSFLYIKNEKSEIIRMTCEEMYKSALNSSIQRFLFTDLKLENNSKLSDVHRKLYYENFV